ncbi:hypothetical protein U6N30_28270 [Blastococcus brunescens]|uniref:Uncharacterized protein n=1 Tax=Blastococcus brunescens TaxID=1564165 RepID=A0ABZ1B3B8_9ACTN|nr:hypothetical protein [Blastococcus sp. BMG 8361]WRL63550.1 hypothetical protein U6N30_28270 [Blastococcus sp. BMG 8361]
MDVDIHPSDRAAGPEHGGRGHQRLAPRGTQVVDAQVDGRGHAPRPNSDGGMTRQVGEGGNDASVKGVTVLPDAQFGSERQSDPYRPRIRVRVQRLGTQEVVEGAPVDLGA